jgi:cobalt-zinc-cadmium efflux system protein
LEDVLGWLAVLVGAGIMYFVDAPFIDPLLSIAILAFILFNVYRNIRQSLRIILQGSPDLVDVDEIEKAILKTDNVEGIHDLHVWSIDGEYNVLTMHVVLSTSLPMLQLHKLKIGIRGKLLSMGIQHSTIEFETPDEDCEMEDCH